MTEYLILRCGVIAQICHTALRLNDMMYYSVWHHNHENHMPRFNEGNLLCVSDYFQKCVYRYKIENCHGSLNSSGNIHENADGPYRSFCYLSFISDALISEIRH